MMILCLVLFVLVLVLSSSLSSSSSRPFLERLRTTFSSLGLACVGAHPCTDGIAAGAKCIETRLQPMRLHGTQSHEFLRATSPGRLCPKFFGDDSVPSRTGLSNVGLVTIERSTGVPPACFSATASRN